MGTKVLSISLDKELIKQINDAAKEEFANRSEFIRNALVERLRVVNEYHAKLANVQPPTEAELFDLLRLKHFQRKAAESRREWRREMRQRLQDTTLKRGL